MKHYTLIIIDELHLDLLTTIHETVSLHVIHQSCLMCNVS